MTDSNDSNAGDAGDDSDHSDHRVEEILADDAKIAAHARANMLALVSELTERGCEEPLAYLDGGYADDERPGCVEFTLECPEGYEGDLVMPGVPLAIVKSQAADGQWALQHNDAPYAWNDLVEELSAFDAARRTIWSNTDLLVGELMKRGLPIQPADVRSDADASGNSSESYNIVVNERKVRVSVPDIAVGPGLSQEMYVDGYPHAWESALDAIFAAAGQPGADS
ncbi:hypothetical protein AB0I10_18965 [Streptomyces sp. NPDC050636]|uniref:hypothetical protein n=1 Tax=Streptomyces sp. NPDC050636 TaxID=3154510 RepID=UPI0034228123